MHIRGRTHSAAPATQHAAQPAARGKLWLTFTCADVEDFFTTLFASVCRHCPSCRVLRACMRKLPYDCPQIITDHLDTVMVEHYRTGTNDIARQKSVAVVQPHFPRCSSQQSGMASAFPHACRLKFSHDYHRFEIPRSDRPSKRNMSAVFIKRGAAGSSPQDRHRAQHAVDHADHWCALHARKWHRWLVHLGRRSLIRD